MSGLIGRSTRFQGVANIDIKDSTPDWRPYQQPIAPEGAPSVLYVVLDDAGFSALEPFGGTIETPNIKRIADDGLLPRRRLQASPDDA